MWHGSRPHQHTRAWTRPHPACAWPPGNPRLLRCFACWEPRRSRVCPSRVCPAREHGHKLRGLRRIVPRACHIPPGCSSMPTEHFLSALPPRPQPRLPHHLSADPVAQLNMTKEIVGVAFRASGPRIPSGALRCMRLMILLVPVPRAAARRQRARSPSFRRVPRAPSTRQVHARTPSMRAHLHALPVMHAPSQEVPTEKAIKTMEKSDLKKWIKTAISLRQGVRGRPPKWVTLGNSAKTTKDLKMYALLARVSCRDRPTVYL